MPCPLFEPTAPLGGFAPDAAPLGDLYSGRCAAAQSMAIPIDTIRQHCNFGYARGVCGRAAGIETDAVRFVVKSHSEHTVHVDWAVESNHHPVAVGSLSIAPGLCSDGEPIERQARAYVSSYLRQTGRG